MEWKTIKDFDNYVVSTNGDIKSKPRCGTKGGLIKPFLDRKIGGYYKVHLYKNGVQYQPFIHRLVAETFLPKVKDKNEVNHKNGNKLDNRVENLEWCTRSENMLHANEKGLIGRKRVVQLQKGKVIKIFPNCLRASKETGIEYATIYWCLNGIFKFAGGYEWWYEEKLKAKGIL